jgi:choline dehydrogenase-like flavoprotein
VVVLEKGPRLRQSGDFRRTQEPQYMRRFLKSVSGRGVALTFIEALGGASAFYEMVSLRAPTCAFEQRGDRGRPLWPEALNRGALDPWYALAEATLEVEQIPLEQVPKTGQVFALMMKKLGYSCERARYAVRGCVGAGHCVTGCTYGAKRWLMTNYLPEAADAGARIECDLEAIMRPVEEGATTSLFCAAAPELAAESGLYYQNSQARAPSPAAGDVLLARELWRRSAEWCGLPPD